MKEYLLLKFGTVVYWNLLSDTKKSIVEKYFQYPVSRSLISQKDTQEQKKILCDLIDNLDGEIQEDWDGKFLTKEEAKDYIMNYSEIPEG